MYHVFSEDIVTSTPSAYVNLPKEMVKRCRNPGDELHTDIPALLSSSLTWVMLPTGTTEYSPRLYNYSDARVVNASFLRCNSLSLSYTPVSYTHLNRWILVFGLWREQAERL